MKPSTSTVALGLMLSLAAPAGMAFAADSAEQALLDRAAFWRAQQRPDVAAETLNRILARNPNQPDALYQLAALATQRGDAGRAQRYFHRLRQLASTDPHAAVLLGASPAVVTPLATSAKSDPVELAAVSADSDDLNSTAPPALKAPIEPAPRPSVAPAASQAARGVQVASLTDETVSDDVSIPASPSQVREAGSPDLGITDASIQVAQLELMPPPPVGGYQRPAAAAEYSPTDTLEMDIDRDLSILEQQANPSLIASLGFRWHDGTEGLSSLTEFGAADEVSFSPWYTGTAKLTVLPVYVNAGTISPGNLVQFGANPILAAKGRPLIQPGEQAAFGVGLLGGYSLGDFTAQIGTSPLGFTVTNLVGLAAYAPRFFDDTLTIRFAGLRQPVTDSYLSYGGTHAEIALANSLTNNSLGPTRTWGGVTKNGGNISAFYDNQMVGGYASVEYAEFLGTNVPSNSEIDGLLGAYFRPYKTDHDQLRVGISVYYEGFRKNLDGFTFGQGGYYSPSNLEALTFPVEYSGHTGPWSYLGSVALGVQHANNGSTLIFPNNPSAEAVLVNTPGALSIISGSSSTGLAANVKGQVEYALDDSTSIGAAFSYNNGNNYNEIIGQVYLRKTFDWLAPLASDPQAIARRDQPLSRL